ncbi:MAG: leucine-rich repeat domain-containing protein, partial [Ruminococcus sp.]|nr:leucine-rich repeat domain-containing protein [Ruminococcus sp.]
MSKMKKIAAMTAALLISANTMGYLPQDSIIISNVTANAAEVAAESVKINESYFPDAIFRQYIADNFDKDGDGVLSAEEIKYGGVIDVTNMGISDLTGIEYFTDLAFLNCNKNNLTALDVSNNTALEQLGCYENHLTSLDVSNNTALEWLWCNDNQLTTLDLSKNTVLDALNCGNNQFISLDVSNNTALTELYLDDNKLTSLDVSNNTALTDLYCTRNQLSSLDVTNNTALKYLYCYDNQLSSLNLSNNKLLENLNCDNNNITTLDVSNNKSLVYLICDNNNLTTLDVNNNKKLVLLCCNGNQLTSIDVSNNTSLTAFWCEDNKYEIALTGNTFDLSTLPIEFDVTKASEWTNGTVEGNILTVEDVTKEVTYKYDCGNEYSKTFTLISQKKETPVSTTTTVPTTTAPETTTTTTKIYQSVNYSCSLSVYPYDEADTIYEIGEELDLSTICVNGHGKITWDLGTSYSYVDIPYMSLDKCSSVTVDASEFDNTKPGTYTIYVKWHDAVDSFDVTVVESDNAETPVETTTTPAAPKTTTTTTTTTTTPETITTTTTTANIESDSTTNTTTSTTYTPAATSTTAKPIPTPIETYGTCGAQGSNVTWTYDGNGTLTISGEGKMSNWSSDESPWFNKQEIETIIIEDGITNIGSFAFRYCHSLISITIPESVTSIGYDAFNFCDSLTSITIPESLTDIRPGAFSGSKWFTTQQEKNLFVIVNGILIDGTACKGDVVIPDSVKTINEEAFERCYDLTEITIPESVTSIGKEAFNSCDSLNKITIKNPDCEIYDAAETICDGYYFSLFDYFTGKIYGYKNSTAQAYAEKYNIRFVAIDETPAETTTTATTTAPEITTTTTTTTAEEEITSVEINETNFPDYLLRYYITKYIDTDTDNILSAEEIADVTKLNISVGGIRELTGIHYFKNLEDLDCSGNKLTTIDISNFTALTRLDCGKNKLTSLDVSNNSALETLWCKANQLTSLDLSNNTALAYLSCSNNQLTSLDLSNNTALAYLYCYDNQLTSLDLSNNTALTELDCGKNQLTSLDVSNNTALTELDCGKNQFTSLDVSNNTALTRLECYENQLTSLDVSNCSALTYLGCSNNQLTSLDVSNTKMQSTSAYQNKYEIALIGNTFDLSTLPTGFDVSKASNWTNGTVDGNILTVEDITKEVTYKYDC